MAEPLTKEEVERVREFYGSWPEGVSGFPANILGLLATIDQRDALLRRALWYLAGADVAQLRRDIFELTGPAGPEDLEAVRNG